ncbi:MAG: RluA family pseudouridine synthase [Lachnospiraceae bacterium]|nr:RluA family pseudouridine synthase [Lachnospiraceae bacterium]
MTAPDIIYEDELLLVVRKPAGVESQRGKTFAADMESILKNYLSRKNPAKVPYLGVVHRLDRPVAGVMVYAKTKEAAAALSRQFADKTAAKEYEALIMNPLDPEAGRLTDRLESDPGTNLSRIITDGSGGKEAILDYQMIPIEESRAFSVDWNGANAVIRVCGQISGTFYGTLQNGIYAVRVRLLTGRHHQIRAQLAYAKSPILGDLRYGSPVLGLQMKGAIALCAVHLSFRHPKTGKEMNFSIQ